MILNGQPATAVLCVILSIVHVLMYGFCQFFSLRPQNHDTVEVDNDDMESPNSSLELDQDFMYRYSVTPPLNPRELKRCKERSRSFKHKEEVESVKIEKERREKIRQMHRTAANASTMIDNKDSGSDEEYVASNDVDVSSGSSAKKKRDSSKIFNVSRNYDRDYKQSSTTDLASMDSLATPVQTIKIDSPNRFFSLNSKPVSASSSIHNTKNTSPIALLTISQKRRQSLPHISECPKDRMEFFKVFSMLINMGSTSKKEAKEYQGRGPGPAYTRQPSMEEVWQTKLNDLIWLELQAWQHGKTMKEQDQYLCKAREKVAKVLDEVIQFKVVLEIAENDRSVPSGDSSGTCRSNTQYNEPSLFNAIERQKEALMQVTEILNKLEAVEKLFPNTKAISKEYELYVSDAFQLQVTMLCLWKNLTKEIALKLQLMAKVLYVEKVPSIPWPWLEDESPCLQDIHDEPDVMTPDMPEEDEDEEVEEEEEYSTEEEELVENIPEVSHLDPARSISKNVRFNISDTSLNCDDAGTPISMCPSDSSTPIKKPASTSRSTSMASSSMSRTSSTASIEDMSSTCIYRYFVDRTLKKTGLRKLLVRLKDLLHGTLSRARQALENSRSPPIHPDIVRTEVSSIYVVVISQ